MPGGKPVKKPINNHSVKPDRKRDNFDDFNKNEYETELIKKEQQYKDCLEYIERLEKEIKRYQSIVPLEAIDTRATSVDYVDDINSHKESMGEYMELVINHPLLHSYEQNIRSLERDLENQENSYNNLKGDLEKTMDENEELKVLLVKKTKELNKALEGNSSIPLPDETERERARRLGGTSEEMLNLIETMKNDQEALIDQIESLKIRNEGLEKVTEEKESRFHELQSAAEQATTECFKIRQEFDKLKHTYDSLNNEFHIVNGKLEKESREKDDLLSKEKNLESKMNELSKHLNHLKESYNELGDKKAAEVDALSREISESDLRERELKGRIEILERDKFDVEEEFRKIKRDLAGTKNDNQNMIQIMEQYETEIENHKKRAKQIDTLSEEYQEKIENTRLEKDRLNLKEQHYLSKINKLEEENRADAKDRDEKYTTLIESLKAKQRLVIEERDSEISELNKRYSDYYAQNEKNKIENDRLRSEITKLEKALRDSKHEVDKKCDDYERKLRNSNEEKDENHRRLENDNLQYKSEIETLQLDIRNLNQNCRDLESKLATYKSDYDKLSEDYRRTKESYRVEREEKENCELEMLRIKDLYNTKMQDLQKRLDKHQTDETEKNESVLTERNNYLKIIKNLEHLNEKWKAELNSTVDYFSRLVMSLNQENQQYKDQNLELKKEMKRKDIGYGVDKDTRFGKSKSRERIK
ncbi:unnamed protein product [Moneuplotes crassus]|uniref:Uncharacterized protein n=2 Tax=Euplotes crassus TaxID=5936 RepID=A0AAD1X1L5_EUPCR|nr:unnamed protein product [Moneuplotes crassus]